ITAPTKLQKTPAAQPFPAARSTNAESRSSTAKTSTAVRKKRPRNRLYRLQASPSTWPICTGRDSTLDLAMGELEHERRAVAGLRLDTDLAAHPSRELAADVEAEAGSAWRLRQMRIDPVELLED